MSSLERPEYILGIKVPYLKSELTLRKIIETGQLSEKLAAITALSEKSTHTSLELLVAYTNSDNSRLQRQAIAAIAHHKYGHQCIDIIKQHLKGTAAEAAIKAMFQLRMPDLLEEIKILLSHENPHIRWRTLTLMEQNWEPHYFDLICQLFLRDTDPETLKTGGWILVRKANADNWLQIFNIFYDCDFASFRTRACNLAEVNGDQSILSKLESLLNDVDGHVRKAALRAIKSIKAGKP